MATEPLQIEPPGIQFVYELGRELCCHVQLKNTTNVVLRIEVKSNGRYRYRIEPPKLLLEPGARGSVDLTCETLKSKPGGMFGAHWESFSFEVTSMTPGATDSPVSLKNPQKMKVPVTFTDPGSPRITVPSPGSKQGIPTPSRMSSLDSPAMSELETTEAANKRLQKETEALRGGRTLNTGELSSTEREEYELKIKKLVDHLDAAKERAVLAHRSLLSVRQNLAEQKETCQKEKDKLAEEKAKMEKEVEAARSQTAELAELRVLCSEAVTRCDKLKEELDEKVKELQGQKQISASLQNNLDQMGGKQQDGEIDRLRGELRLMTENCNQGLQQIEVLQEALEAEHKLAQESKTLAKEKQALKSRNDSLEVENERLKQEVMNSKLQLAPEGNIPEELLDLRCKLQEANAQIKRQEGLHKKVREELTRAKMEIKRLEKSGITATSESHSEGNRSISIGQQDGNLGTRDSADKRIAELEALVVELTATIENHKKGSNSIPNGHPFGNFRKEEGEEEESPKEKLKELTQENDNLIDEVQYLQREKEQLAETVRKLNDRLAKASKEEEEKEESPREKLKELTQENDNLIDEVQYLQREKEQSAESIRKLNDQLAKVSKVAAQLESLERERGVVLTECEQLKKQLREVKAENQQKEQQLLEQKSEMEWLQQEAKNMEEQKQVSDLQEALERSESSYKEIERFSDSLQVQLQRLQNQRADIEAEAQRKAQLQVVSMNSELNSAREQTRQVLSQMEDMQSKHESQISSLQASLKDLRAKMEESQPDSVYLSQCLASLEAEKKEQERILSNTKDKLNQALRDLSEATSARTEAEKELAAVKEDMDFLELKMERSAIDARQYSSKVDLLTKRLRDSEEERRRGEENEEEITRLQTELRQREVALQTAQAQLQRQKQEEARRQQALQENLSATDELIQTLQKDAMGALNEKGQLEEFISTLEILDPYRRGHVLKLRKRPNFTCAACRQIGGGFGWKCGDRGCPDMMHIGCAVPHR